MTIYKIVIEKTALKFIMAQPKNQQARIFKAIHKLPEGNSIKAMQGQENTFRLRVGDYRIIYQLIPKGKENDFDIVLVDVIDAGSRGQIYNRY